MVEERCLIGTFETLAKRFYRAADFGEWSTHPLRYLVCTETFVQQQ